MSSCPGCGRCRECGQPAAQRTWPWPQPVTTTPPWTWPQTITPLPNTTPFIYTGDPMPGQSGSITVTCQSNGSAL